MKVEMGQCGLIASIIDKRIAFATLIELFYLCNKNTVFRLLLHINNY